jgi:hypothetical protein
METPPQSGNPPASPAREPVAWGSVPTVEDVDRIVALAERPRELTQRVITECLMTLTLPPDQVLRLGRDVPADFPEMLRQLTSPELQALLARIDPTANSVRESGTDDWSDLNDRMHFIADLFRVYQEGPQLFHPSFTPEQVLAIKAGRQPEGRL